MKSQDDLLPYQQDAIDAAYECDELIMRLAMGAGKTVILATALQELLAEGVISRALVFAPALVAKTTWPDEFEDWSHLDPKGLTVLRGDPAHRKQQLADGKPIVVCSMNLIPWFFETVGRSHGFDCLVIDELTRIKKRAVWSNALTPRLRDFKIRLGATGTFISEGVKDAYGQAYLIDRGKRLGRTLGAFRRDFMYYTGPNHWNWEPKPDAEEQLTRRLQDITFQIDGSEYEDQLPPLRTIEVPVDLPTHARRAYDEMKAEHFLDLDGQEILPANAGVEIGKLQQIADGFLYGDDLEATATWLHDAKLDALEELIEETDRPLLVVYKYRAELEKMRERFPAPYLGAGVSDDEAKATISQWNRGEWRRLYVHPQAAGHGINLQAGSNTIVWFGLPWSLDQYDQTNARLRRRGQESDTVFAYHIVARDTVDRAILTALHEKRNVQEAIFEGLRRAE